MSKTRNPLSPERWAYLKALQPSPGRYIHISAHVRMLDNPAWKNGPKTPWIEKPGHTLRMRRMNKRADKIYEHWRRTHGDQIRAIMALPSEYTTNSGAS